VRDTGRKKNAMEGDWGCTGDSVLQSSILGAAAGGAEFTDPAAGKKKEAIEEALGDLEVCNPLGSLRLGLGLDLPELRGESRAANPSEPKARV
jgi:hypothetical protein